MVLLSIYASALANQQVVTQGSEIDKEKSRTNVVLLFGIDGGGKMRSVLLIGTVVVPRSSERRDVSKAIITHDLDSY